LKYNNIEIKLHIHVLKLANVTVLHSSEAYVCGAIALAQSILRTKKNNILQYNKNYTRDLILLADKLNWSQIHKGSKIRRMEDQTHSTDFKSIRSKGYI
jgi:hypothetical protein